MIIITFTNCKKQEEIIPEDNPRNLYKGVLVSNEGNFNWGNASLSVIEPEKKKIYNYVYKQKNNKMLGDILQSIYVFDEDAFLVVNNSAKIVRISLKDFKEKNVYSTFTSPRYMYIYNRIAFVSDLYSNRIYVFDIESKPIDWQNIAVNGWTEEMDAIENKLYIAGVTANKLYVVDMENKILIDSITTSNAPFSVKADKYGYIWVYCGDYQSENYVLEKIDPNTKEIVTRITLSANENTFATKMAINKEKTDIWFIHNGIKHVSVTDTTYDVFATSDKFQTPYGIGIDNEGRIYVADAKNFTSEGDIIIFNPDGSVYSELKAGIIPGYFAFYNLYE